MAADKPSSDITAQVRKALAKEIRSSRAERTHLEFLAGGSDPQSPFDCLFPKQSPRHSPSLAPAQQPDLGMPDPSLVGLGEADDDDDGEENSPVKMVRQQSEPTGKLSETSASTLAEPQAFRRHFLQQKADAAGVPLGSQPAELKQSFVQRVRPLVCSGYYGDLLGDDLDELAPLMPNVKQTKLDDTAATVAMFKAFIASGLTFLPSSAAKAGWFFSAITLIVVGGLNALGAYLLLESAKASKSRSLGELARLSGGSVCELMVQISVVVAQMGCCVSYMGFASAVFQQMGLSPELAVLLQLIAIVPLCYVRSVKNLQFANALSSVLIIFGLIAILSYATLSLGANGCGTGVVAAKPHGFGVLVGIAFFTYEGTPNLLPIREAMENRAHFGHIVGFTMLAICVIITTFTLLCYLAYGSEVSAPVLLDIPDNSFASSVKIIYAVAVMLTVPLNFLPMAAVIDRWTFGSRKHEIWTWSIMRWIAVLLIALVAYCAGPSLDLFVSATGAFTAVPLQLLYPAFFHWCLCKPSNAGLALDAAVAVVGIGSVILSVATILPA